MRSVPPLREKPIRSKCAVCAALCEKPIRSECAVCAALCEKPIRSECAICTALREKIKPLPPEVLRSRDLLRENSDSSYYSIEDSV